MEFKMNKEQIEKFLYSMNLIKNFKEIQDDNVHIQILNGELYFNSLIKTLESYCKKNNIYFDLIDFGIKGFLFNEIDSNGNIIEPKWYKEHLNRDTIVVLYNIPKNKYDKNVRMLNEIIKSSKIKGKKINKNLLFVILNDNDTLLEETGINLFKITI